VLGAIMLGRRTPVPRRRIPGAEAVLLIGLALAGSWTAWRIGSGASVGLAETMLLLAMTGLFVAGIFARAGGGSPADEKRLIGPLYAADLIGGCLGSMAAGLILIPGSGLDATASVMVPLSLLCLLLLRK